jgi:hypothetical protein
MAAAVILGSFACRASEQPKAPAPSVAPTPAPLARPTPATPPRRTPPPPSLPAPTPRPPPRTLATPAPAPTLDRARVAALVTSGERALAEGRLTEAAQGFAEALALDPADPQALRGKARTATTRLGLTRTFVPDLASSEGAEGRLKTLDGFDDVEKMDVRRAVRVPGRAELVGTPAHLKPGDAYRVEIYLRNEDRKKKRKIRIANLSVHRIVNGNDEALAVAWKPLELPARERAFVASVSGAWGDDVSSWVLAVRVLSDGGDIYENRLEWR